MLYELPQNLKLLGKSL